MNVYILVPVFKREELTLRFCKSVLSEVSNAQVVIIEDSRDLENEIYFRERASSFSNVKIIRTGFDEWWCSTVQRGLDYLESQNLSDEDIVVMANNDVVLDKGCWERLICKVSNNTMCHPRTFLDSGEEVSSGAKVKSWLPFITQHPVGSDSDEEVDLATARFLVMKYRAVKTVGGISASLIQYHGDSDFSLRAKKMGIKTLVIGDAKCFLFDEDTGAKSHNILSYKQLLSSFFSIRSPNHIAMRYAFVRAHFNPVFSFLVVVSMTINAISRFLISHAKHLVKKLGVS